MPEARRPQPDVRAIAAEPATPAALPSPVRLSENAGGRAGDEAGAGGAGGGGDPVALLGPGLGHLQRLATLGTLAGVIAHEFNNILTPVHTYAQLALDRTDDPALARRALQQALSSSERAAAICQAILGFAGEHSHITSPTHAPKGGRPAAGGHAATSSRSRWAERRRNAGRRSGETPAGGAGAHDQADTRGGTDVQAALHGALRCLARDLSRDGITLVERFPAAGSGPRGAARVEARSILVQQVLLNLVLNARKAMTRAARAKAAQTTVAGAARPGAGQGLELHVSAEWSATVPSPPPTAKVWTGGAGAEGAGSMPARCSTWNIEGDTAATPEAGQDAGWWVVRVADTGPGIPPAVFKRLFQPFVTGDPAPMTSAEATSAQPNASGTGLGLVVCGWFVEQSGGWLWAESGGGDAEANRRGPSGACFTIVWPAAR